MKPDEIANHRFVLDMKTTQDLRTKMQQDPKAGIKDAAKQFEGMFMQMVMKSMRDATPADGLMNSDATRFYTSILDQQMAQQLASTGQMGFARMIEAQLGRMSGASVTEEAPLQAAIASLRNFRVRQFGPRGYCRCGKNCRSARHRQR